MFPDGLFGRLLLVGAAAALAALSSPALAGSLRVMVHDPDGSLGRVGAPVSAAITLTPRLQEAAKRGLLGVRESKAAPLVPAQYEPGARRLCWLLPPGRSGERTFSVVQVKTPIAPLLKAQKDAASGHMDLIEGDRRVLRYNLAINEPGDRLKDIAQGNLIYARARADYIHPLYGPDGEELTKDWSVDHPHHRGIYWAWPEVDWHGQRGDLHALQLVFARPTGNVRTVDGPVYSQIESESLWKWEDRDPIVREVATIRAYRETAHGRWLDLTFDFTALGDDVSLARRGTEHYGGLNVRLAKVDGQKIDFHTDDAAAAPRMAWADLTGSFAGGKGPVGIVILQSRRNPDYPGDWVQYPELNWFQPTFPAAKTRYVLRKGETLTLRFRLWIRSGAVLDEARYRDAWRAYDVGG